MNRLLIFSLLGVGMTAIVGCSNNTESIKSNDLYVKVPEKNMRSYCKREVMKEFGYHQNSIFLYPLKYKKGAKLVYGKYRVDNMNLNEFVCIFNSNDTYAGIKMEYSHVKNELCYSNIIR